MLCLYEIACGFDTTGTLHMRKRIDERFLPSEFIVAGGGIGGLAAALALARRDSASRCSSKAPLRRDRRGHPAGPNAFFRIDALGIGERARGRAVYTDEIVMKDAMDETGSCASERRGVRAASAIRMR